MTAIQFSVEALLAELDPGIPAPVPVGEPVSLISSNAISAQDRPVKTGVWRCTPGKWVRQVKQAEFCHFLDGEATFIPDDGNEPIEIGAGSAVYFPANSMGTWEIRKTCVKIFIVFDEGTA